MVPSIRRARAPDASACASMRGQSMRPARDPPRAAGRAPHPPPARRRQACRCRLSTPRRACSSVARAALRRQGLHRSRVPVVDRGHRALDLARHGQVADGHLAQDVVHVDDEGLRQSLAQAPAGLALARQAPEHQGQVQRHHLEAALRCVGDPPLGVEGLADVLASQSSHKGIVQSGADPAVPSTR